MATNIPSELRYTQDHEWVRIEGGTATVGVTDYAQKQLGDVVFVELPSVGRSLERSEPLGTIESVKAVSEIYAPLSGEVAAVNETINDDPELVNTDPYGDGWLIKLTISNKGEVAELLSGAKYEAWIREGD